jgi:hypothetical protein
LPHPTGPPPNPSGCTVVHRTPCGSKQAVFGTKEEQCQGIFWGGGNLFFRRPHGAIGGDARQRGIVGDAVADTIIAKALRPPNPTSRIQAIGQRIAQRVGIGRRHAISDPRQIRAVGIGIGQGRHVGGSILQAEGTQAIVEIIACCGYESIAVGEAG